MTSDPGGAARFKHADAESYDAFAEEFDQFEEIRKPLVQTLFAQIDWAGCERMLDVGTGTGLIALEAARRLGPATKVYGVDLSDGMLLSARRKAVQRNLVEKTRFLKMDAEALAFSPQTFDAVVSLFSILHFPSPKDALAEQWRVLRPGGSVLVALGSGPPRLSIQGLRHRIARSPDLLRLARGRLLIAPGFLETLLQRMFPSDSGSEETALASHSKVRGRPVEALLREVGFAAIGSHWEGYQHTFADPEQFWLVQRVYSSVARKKLAALSEQDRERVKQSFLETCVRVQSRGGRLIYPFAAHFVRATKP